MSEAPRYLVMLSDDELLLLDGRCAPKIQAEVDAAKGRRAAAARFSGLPEGLAVFVAKAVREATEHGKLRFGRVSLSSCTPCGRVGGYFEYKSGRRKGQPNYDRPRYFEGVELSDSRVSFQGRANCGCCAECWGKVRATVAEALADVRAEMPEAATGVPPRWKRWDNHRCTACGWEGHEGELGPMPAVFGGHYPGRCPKCGGANRPFGPRVVESREGFTLVPAPAAKEATA